ncbi:MAG TPA: intradiol ring-cleavage dioxygenase [Blastocatellia bacterium]|nr:intradiol ring-cleavage dioxygenase [Blastocatellia bacterium]
MKLFLVWVLLTLLVNCQSAAQSQKKIVGGGCDGCEAIYEGMPAQLGWETTITDKAEPGEPLEISGTVYRADGRTPAADVILYVYHTSAKGYYEPAPGATGQSARHGRLRGWMKTDGQGRYKFRTIKPAPYPGRSIPAHIHPIIKEADKNEYYIDEFLFDDDPLLVKAERAKQENRGGSGIIKLARDQRGVLIGHRDIVLGMNIPNYK